MPDFVSVQPRLNRRADLLSWLIVLIFLIAIPLIVTKTLPSNPPPGPVYNPSMLIMFLGLQSLIIIMSLVVIFQLFRAKANNQLRSGLPQQLHTSTNVLNKFIGGLFILSGFVKLQDITGFSYKLDDYWNLFGLEFLTSYSVHIAWFVSVFEVGIALALMTGFAMRLTTIFMLLMIVFFTLLTGLSSFIDSLQDCGCFGDALKLKPIQSFIKDVFLLIAILPLFFLRKKIKPYYRSPIPFVAAFGSFAIAGYLSYYCYQHLEIFDFRGAYKVGQDLEYNMNNMDSEDQIIAHDFYPCESECPGFKDFEGATLYVIAYNMQKSPEWTWGELATLVKDIKAEAPGVKVGLLTNTGRRDRDPILTQHGLQDLCISGEDEKVIKTMIRSSPGYFFMKDGIITQKWHYNDIPTAKELLDLAPEYAKIPPPPPVVADSMTVDSAAIDSFIIEKGDSPTSGAH